MRRKITEYNSRRDGNIGDGMRGKFVTFEGCEGVGKSTQVRLLREYLEKNGKDAIFTREPGGTAVCEAIRKIILNPDFGEMCPKTEAFLYAASRAQLVHEVIIPALTEGRTVFCDRFYDSSFAYQGIARGQGADMIEEINAIALAGAVPDLTIFLDLDPVIAFERKGGRDAGDRMENEKIDFHKKVYEGYRIAAERYADRFVCIKPVGSKYDTHGKIVELLKERGII